MKKKNTPKVLKFDLHGYSLDEANMNKQNNKVNTFIKIEKWSMM